jgi:putative peptidoglycan lipid II flippase
VGWLLQGLIQIPPLYKLGYRYRPSLQIRSEGMKKVFTLMGPVMVSTWVQPINLVINSRFGSRLYEGAGVSALEYATNLYLVIAGTFVLSITNVIFPRLSRMTAGGQEGDFRDTLRQTLHGCLFFVLPMSAGLMVVAKPLISFLYGGGEFDEFSIQITSTALVWLSLGMVGYAIQNILSRAYFAKQDGRGPLVAGAISIGVNILLCMVLAKPFEVAGLAFSSAVSSTVYALLLLAPMQRQGARLLDGDMVKDLGKMLAASIGMGLCAWAVLRWAETVLPAGKLGELMTLGLTALTGVAVYGLLALALRLKEAQLGVSFLTRLKRG